MSELRDQTVVFVNRVADQCLSYAADMVNMGKIDNIKDFDHSEELTERVRLSLMLASLAMSCKVLSAKIASESKKEVVDNDDDEQQQQRQVPGT